MGFVWWIIVGLIAGWATGKIMRGSGYGALWDIVVGIVGAVIGGWIMRSLGFAGQGGLIYTILVAIGGAIVLTFLVLADLRFVHAKVCDIVLRQIDAADGVVFGHVLPKVDELQRGADRVGVGRY